jgi:NADPH-dependent 2,4-dienoyl-CoA reductase/sulfur reductase-like enzyme
VTSAGVVVVGGSIGGVRTVQRLRAAGYAGAVTLVEREPHLPYDKPPLSKLVLEVVATPLPVLLTEEQADRLGVELLLGTEGRRLDVASHTLELSHGASLTYDALVVATGARARPSPWAGTPRVLELRGWDDAVRLRTALEGAERLVVIGAGFIGAEVSSAARKRGVAVDLVDVAEIPMARHLGPGIGSQFSALHHRHGVQTHFGVGVERLDSREDGVDVVLTDGTSLSADLVVVGLGTQLNTEWLAGSGVRVEDGVVCDSRGRVDGAVDVYAVGDAARWWHPAHGSLVRAEHWTNAVEQAAVVAHTIADPGSPQEHNPVGYVWSNQYDWKIQMAGSPWLGLQEETIRDPASDRFAVLWGDEAGLLCGVLTVNWPQLAVRGRQSLLAQRSLVATVDLMRPADGATVGMTPRGGAA